jgi:hypothetical protein
MEYWQTYQDSFCLAEILIGSVLRRWEVDVEFGHPLRVVTPTLDGDVLAVLARADKQYTPGDLRRILGRSVAGLRSVLQRLVEQGVVLEQRTPNAVLYSLNAKHLAAEPLRALAGLRATLLDRLSDSMDVWDRQAVFAALFGSAARGDMRADSDLDLFIVRPDALGADDDAWGRQLATLAEQVTSWTGNDARILEYPESRVRAAKEPVLAVIADEGVPVAGTMRWLRAAMKAGD